MRAAPTRESAPIPDLRRRSLFFGGGWRHTTRAQMPLGLRTFFGGPVHYRIENRSFTVDENTWLVVNDQQPYTITFDSPTLVRSFLVFFPAGWADDVAHTSRASTRTLLDHPVATVPARFFETVTEADPLVMPRLRRLMATRLQLEMPAGWLEEQLRDLLAALVRTQARQRASSRRLDALRTSTRDELFRRLTIGRDYLRATAQRAPSLADAAAVASLSPYHFQRSFAALYRETPHDFVTRCRLERARRMIADSNLAITGICLASGYDSFGAFNRAFKLRYGRPPSAFRKN